MFWLKLALKCFAIVSISGMLMTLVGSDSFSSFMALGMLALLVYVVSQDLKKR